MAVSLHEQVTWTGCSENPLPKVINVLLAAEYNLWLF